MNVVNLAMGKDGLRHLGNQRLVCGKDVPVKRKRLIYSLTGLRNFIFNKGSETNCPECEELKLREVCDFQVPLEPTPEGMRTTLNPEEVVSDHQYETGLYCHRHPDKWMIKGIIYEDAYYWVEDFVAYHPKYKFVFGNFEEDVYASSEEAYKDFISKHTPHTWDGGDI
jgi:hypothetical protein